SAYLKATFLEVTPNSKPYLHAASVMVSNYMIALMESAGQMAALGGLDKNEVQKALFPLMQKSVSNISRSDDLPEALSGPIARGDTVTVADHLELLKQDKQLSVLYKRLGDVLIQLLKKEGSLSDEKIRALTDILRD